MCNNGVAHSPMLIAHSRDLTPNVLVLGAGPAGLAAAQAAAHGGAQVLLLDSNPAPGGQIWRGANAGEPSAAGKLLRDVQNNPLIEIRSGCTLAFAERVAGRLRLVCNGPAGAFGVQPQRIILATGATELFLPFPGWTLPGVVGAGGLQAMVKAGLDVAGQRVVLAGSGPLLLAVAATLRQRGAKVLALAEQAPLTRLARFGMAAGKPKQAAELLWGLRGVPFWADTYPLRASGEGRLESVTLQRAGRKVTLACDWLATGFSLLPDLRAATLLGCNLENGAVLVDSWQQTSVAGVYAAGEVTGIGGVEKALAEGKWAGRAATGQIERLHGPPPAATFTPFVQAIAQNFALRPELRDLPDPQTIVCRCEDVRHAELKRFSSWTQAKLQTRCGMGACQGRICGGAASVLYGWDAQGVRPPLFPTSIASLLELSAVSDQPSAKTGHELRTMSAEENPP